MTSNQTNREAYKMQDQIYRLQTEQALPDVTEKRLEEISAKRAELYKKLNESLAGNLGVHPSQRDRRF